jgi:dephospho-CoA kinase
MSTTPRDRLFVGLTGGVASGKSTVAQAFGALHPGCVVDADVAARSVVAAGSEGLAAVVDVFGPDVLQADGSLDRAALRRTVFADPSARKQLEGLLHPRIRTWMLAQAAQAASPYVVFDIPLLTEGGGRTTWPMLQRVLVVDAPVSTQRARLKARDGVDTELADQMIAAQATRAQRLPLANDVIVNLGTVEDAIAAVSRLDHHWTSLAQWKQALIK